MSATVWGKFFWSDWRSDPGLRACSFAARGLWMDLLCLAAEAEPKGFVSVAGRACDAKAIARLTGGQMDEVVTLIAELEEHGVFSRDQKGSIFSRRMVADAERSRTGSAYGKRGGSTPELPLPLLPGVGGERGGDPPTQSPEARVQKPDSKGERARASTPHTLPDDWQLAPIDFLYAADKGFLEKEAVEIGEAFRDHHRNKGTRGLDWHAAWRTWCRNEIKFSTTRKSNGGGSNENGRNNQPRLGFSGLSAQLRAKAAQRPI